MKYWEIIADNLSKAGWNWGCVSALDSAGRTIWIADAHRDNGKRFIVRTDEILKDFSNLKRAPRIALPKCQIIRHNPRHVKKPCENDTKDRYLHRAVPDHSYRCHHRAARSLLGNSCRTP